ncbi:MbtH family protein [Streptomyces sp. NBC_01217]|uniref:MbtH family protein n=1 Tax=Streptomyces sp. NBC_01217 TaxID=2903779 RepID=UPI002E140752|nr:MbtH family protein [Streptomyces sp. NBC_01217]
MTNPFEDETRQYLVLVNDEEQYSLWPREVTVPGGWAVGHGPGSRAECLQYVERTWTDMRPASLRRRSQQ